MALITVGSKVPNVTLKWIGPNGPEDVQTEKLFAGKKVVLFSLPGAFTPTCSQQHLPGYVAKAGELHAKGVDDIVCLAVNDHWVMKAWGEAHGAAGKVTMLPDGIGLFTKALGLEVDLGTLGMRGKRAVLIVDDGVVKSVELEPAKGVEVTSAEACLARLG
jgi:glutaredoxin/glutathione-dependent peroxiredoxin